MTNISLRLYSQSIIFGLLLLLSGFAVANEVNIYSYRQAHLIDPLLERFSQETGIRTNVLHTDKGIAEKMFFEGENSPVDLVLTVDIYRLTELKERGLAQPVTELAADIARTAESLHDPDNQWFALTRRPRIIFATSDESRAPLGEVQNYAALAAADLGERVCIRPLSHIYNLGLTASLIAQYGEVRVASWLAGLQANLARRPQGNDRAQITAVASGQCDYAVANFYYFNLLLKDNPELAEQIRFITPKADQGGTHMNVSGMALARYAPNRENAVRLMRFLLADWAQETYGAVNNEIPVVRGVPAPAEEDMGAYDPQSISLETIARNINQAQELVSRSGIDL